MTGPQKASSDNNTYSSSDSDFQLKEITATTVMAQGTLCLREDFPIETTGITLDGVLQNSFHLGILNRSSACLNVLSIAFNTHPLLLCAKIPILVT